MKEEEVTVFVDMHEGSEEATAWGCDLTYDYVKINADYRS
ncbi:MAG: Arginine biosynthesis bifunctional protein ArgJ [Firmicutes bacterium ADurb.Bin354]|nr:MAG: Arginine biosynthesis bifunctional protein ArgJ [Firmicutes bacterium ADurb.Bin354]